MSTIRLPVKIASLVYALAILACSIGAPDPTATPVPTNTNTPLPPTLTPTNTPKPTATPKPTQTPNLAATAQAEAFNAVLNSFVENGLLDSTEGTTTSLDDFTESWAQIGWFQYWVTGESFNDFVFSAHFKWSTASSTPENSGCGIVFGLQDNGDYYAVFLDKARIIFYMKRGSYVYAVGKTSGPGRVSFGNPAEADFAAYVQGQKAYVSVDGVITTYTLSADQTSAGELGYTLLSGTNKDFGTRCEMTNVTVWEPK